MDIDSAISKARKLLRLAQSDNANEAASAAAQAQALLDKYEIDRALLEIDTGEETPDEPIEDFSKKGAHLEQSKGRQMERWRSWLAQVVAGANACEIYISYSGGRRTIEIVGRPSDADKVRYLFAFLCRETQRLCDRDGKGCGRSWRNNFRLGVVDSVRAKFKAQRTAAEVKLRRDAGADSMALVRVDRALARVEQRLTSINSWITDNLDLTSGGGGGYVHHNTSARAAGRAAGRTISMGSARGSLGSGTRRLRD